MRVSLWGLWKGTNANKNGVMEVTSFLLKYHFQFENNSITNSASLLVLAISPSDGY